MRQKQYLANIYHDKHYARYLCIFISFHLPCDSHRYYQLHFGDEAADAYRDYLHHLCLSRSKTTVSRTTMVILCCP